MFWLKSCPKCGGDVYAEHRDVGADITCLQCGYVVTGEDRILLLQQARRRSERRERARPRRLVGAR